MLIAAWVALAASMFSNASAQHTDAPVQLAVGRAHACVAEAGHVWCWGHDAHGQLGGAGAHRGAVAVGGLPDDVVQIDAGSERTCALSHGRGLFCWGAEGTRTEGASGAHPLHDETATLLSAGGGGVAVGSGARVTRLDFGREARART